MLLDQHCRDESWASGRPIGFWWARAPKNDNNNNHLFGHSTLCVRRRYGCKIRPNVEEWCVFGRLQQRDKSSNKLGLTTSVTKRRCLLLLLQVSLLLYHHTSCTWAFALVSGTYLTRSIRFCSTSPLGSLSTLINHCSLPSVTGRTILPPTLSWSTS